MLQRSTQVDEDEVAAEELSNLDIKDKAGEAEKEGGKKGGSKGKGRGRK